MCTFQGTSNRSVIDNYTSVGDLRKIIKGLTLLGKASESLELTEQRLPIYNRFELEGN